MQSSTRAATSRTSSASAAEALADSTGHYLFISSVSVYGDFSEPRNEDSPLEELADDKPADRLLDDYSNYGALKALCERAVEETIPDRHALVRPGLIVGPHDPTGRFTYWPHRIARGGEVLVPGPPEQTVQFVDVRDLGGWLIDLSEQNDRRTLQRDQRRRLVANARGDLPRRRRQRRRVSRSSTATISSSRRWASGWSFRSGSRTRRRSGMHRTDVSRAIEAGLTFRPLDGDGPRHARRGRDDGQRRNGGRARGGDPGRVEGSVASPAWMGSTSCTTRGSVFETSTPWAT